MTRSPGFHSGCVEALDHADEIDSGDHREAAHHRRLAAHRQTVLVVDRGPLDAHRHVAVHQFRLVEIDELGGLSAFALVNADRSESRHAIPLKTFNPGRISGPADAAMQGGDGSRRQTWASGTSYSIPPAERPREFFSRG